MRLEKLRQVDLNLLITFAVIAEEKSVTAAAERLFLSQPAVSRALQRARAMFSDDLLVRSANGFEPTPRGRKMLQQLETLLPSMEALFSPSVFDPRRERSHFRISGPDNVCAVLLPRLCRHYPSPRYKVSFEFLPWQTSAPEMLEHGQLDVFFSIVTSCTPRTSRPKPSTAKTGSAPSPVKAPSAAALRWPNISPRTISSSPRCPACSPFRTSS